MEITLEQLLARQSSNLQADADFFLRLATEAGLNEAGTARMLAKASSLEHWAKQITSSIDALSVDDRRQCINVPANFLRNDGLGSEVFQRGVSSY